MATHNSTSQLGIGRPLRGLAIAWGGALFLSLIVTFAVALALGVFLAAVATVGVSIGCPSGKPA
jgi:hypothetical protein